MHFENRISLYCVKNLFNGWKQHIYPFGLCGNIKKRDEHSRVLVLFVQKNQIGVDGFKLHDIMADFSFGQHRENRLIHMILPMRSTQFFPPPYYAA